MYRIALILTTAIATLGASSIGACGSPKRGWAGGDAPDHNASNASWYYRWWHTIPASASGTNAEFIPLIKYPNNIETKVNHVAGLPGVDTLLVLNEPERPDQSDTTVQEALAIWPAVQAGLPNHKLVSPGVSDNQAGQDWLIDFMNEVDASNTNADPNDDLRVDAIAFHWYGASAPNPVSAANNFMNRVEWYHTQFGLPVWITEFAMHDWEGDNLTSEMIQANADFLEIVLPQLDSLSYVEKYSYYNWFDDAMVFESPDRMPTSIGDQYVDTALPGDIRDLNGQSVGTDIGYLRGGEITNTGAAIPEAMRAIDALGGLSTISGTTDWGLSNRRDNYTRVRPGATLRKTGPNTISLVGILELDGDLEVAEGVLSHAGNSATGAGGAIRVADGATLQLLADRSIFTVIDRDFDTAGVVDGAIRFSSGATLTPHGPAPVFTSNVTVQASTVDVGGPGFTVATPAVSPITAQLRLEYDASIDTPGDSIWSESAGPIDFLSFAGAASPTAINDPAFPGVTAAYPIGQVGGAEGLNQFFEGGGPLSRQDGTFEVVFRVDDTAAGTDQVILEVGGAGRGVAFVLNNDTLLFNVDGDGSDIDLTASVLPGWNHAIGVIDLNGGSDDVALFVNGQPVGAISGQTINDWAGGNLSGVGAGASSVTGVSAGLGSPFHGSVALARFYEATAFDSVDALQNYEALTVAPALDPTTMIVEGNFTVEVGSDLLLDIGDDGAADKIAVDGAITVSGATLSIAHVGSEALTAGDSFDLFDYSAASIDFGSISLPSLDAAYRWRLDGLFVDGSIEVVLAGDLNADGSVDIADYTAWRDTLGMSVLRFTAGDSNGDGFVDESDLAEWVDNFGASVPAAGLAVPEPAALATCFVLPLLLVRGRTR